MGKFGCHLKNENSDLITPFSPREMLFTSKNIKWNFFIKIIQNDYMASLSYPIEFTLSLFKNEIIESREKINLRNWKIIWACTDLWKSIKFLSKSFNKSIGFFNILNLSFLVIQLSHFWIVIMWTRSGKKVKLYNHFE